MITLYKINIFGDIKSVAFSYENGDFKIIEDNVEDTYNPSIDGDNYESIIRKLYTEKFLEGYIYPGNTIEHIDPMKGEKYTDSSSIQYPVLVQPKLNCIKIMYNYSMGNLSFQDYPFIDELSIFISYIPYNCILDTGIYANNIESSAVKILLNKNKYNTIKYIIFDFYSKNQFSCDERLTILKDAYNLYKLDYPDYNNIEIIESYTASNIDEINTFHDACIKEYKGIVIKKIYKKNTKFYYKPGKTAAMLNYC